MSQDDIYALPLENVGDFQFDRRVVDVFPDMISRSVPGYGSILSMIGELAQQYAVADTNIYDLGCSLGAATRIISRRVPKSCTIQAVDSSSAMIARLRELLAAEAIQGCEVALHEADLAAVPIDRASFVVLNFTLQFVPAAERRSVLQTIFDGMLPGGALVLSEKISFDDPQEQLRLTELHHAFKRANGYSELEIAQKRTALEKMMVPETLATHRTRLADVGFATVVPWFQCFNFTSILAVKG
ncbi:carboxy-S-adenosyl-L-methionine synthase CmoA [Rosistilla oblonga]|uniref:carboxy-S-adenosyl-L-methionine synthase CmoA n=1 Tax=Rosistilla oblonga TaxID=2527990 RepID=UPI003A977CDE